MKLEKTEDWGGDVACIPVSALTGMGINDLLERIALEDRKSVV